MKTLINQFTSLPMAILGITFISVAALGLAYLAIKALLFVSQFTPIM